MATERPFSDRVASLPRLGLGISTEFGARHGGVDLATLVRARPDLVAFLEVGVDLERGVDEDARAWAAAGRPTTYHFLDLNLEEAEDLDDAWVEDASALARSIGAAWMCGDAGLWHVGPRERGHGTLMPPVLVDDSARALGDNVRALRERTGFEVLPENPPAHAWVGDLHLAEYLARVAERADCGLLLDVAHLAIHQRATRRAPLEGLDALPFERVVEVHVAGGAEFEHAGRRFVDDDHGLAVLQDTWTILENTLPRATNLRAVVLECERNPLAGVVRAFEDLAARVGAPARPGRAQRSAW